jgi:hypothetical protein
MLTEVKQADNKGSIEHLQTFFQDRTQLGVRQQAISTVSA